MKAEKSGKAEKWKGGKRWKSGKLGKKKIGKLGKRKIGKVGKWKTYRIESVGPALARGLRGEIGKSGSRMARVGEGHRKVQKRSDEFPLYVSCASSGKNSEFPSFPLFHISKGFRSFRCPIAGDRWIRNLKVRLRLRVCLVE